MALLPVAEALARILDGVTPLEAESVDLLAARGRVLAGDIVAKLTQPPFDASAMDGYAVRSADIATVPDVTCQSFGSAKHDLRAAGFVAVISAETRPFNLLCPNGNKVADQDPDGNTQANVGSTVTLYAGEEPSPSPT